MAHRGRRPRQPTAILKRDGSRTESPREVQERWHEHFQDILNIPSSYTQEVIEDMPSLHPRLELDTLPTMRELEEALGKLKTGKAGGKSGIVPELLLHGGMELRERVLQVMQDMWGGGGVVSDWKDAVIVPIPKKGDLMNCDNWRGISLLDVVGKVFARIIQNRLQAIAEDILPESQCGFRRGRGCTDMVFVARQLVEKCREHNDTLYILFVDLRKAYDSVPRPALWNVLERVGVPPMMLSIIRSFHIGMMAEVRTGDTTTDRVRVHNGLRQGCTLAPSLFNIYFSAVVACWRARCPEAGITVKYRHGRKLVGDRTSKSHLVQVKITESQFADDAAVYATSRDAFESATRKFIEIASMWGLTVSIQKTKGMAINNRNLPEDLKPVDTEGGPVEMVNDFTYLGSNITVDGEVGTEAKLRIGKASRAFGCLRNAIFRDRNFSVETKRKVYGAVVLSVLLYGAETWAVKAEMMRRMNGFHNRCIRTIMGVTKYQQWRERITSRRLAAAFGMEETMTHILMGYRLRWLGHLARMEPSRMPKQLLFGELERKRPSHGTKRRWRDLALSDIKAAGVNEDWYTLAQDRREWRALCRDGVSSLVEQHNRGWSSRSAPTGNTCFTCVCGRSFRRKGDLTRHSRFCRSTEATDQ